MGHNNRRNTSLPRMLLGSSSRLVGLGNQLGSLAKSSSHQDTRVVCIDGSGCFPSLLLGLAIPGLAEIPRFNSEVAVTLFLPHHSLREVEKLLGMEEGEEKDLRPAASERARKASNLPEKSSDAPEKEEGGEKKATKVE